MSKETKTYECELWEDQMWRYYVKVEAKDEQEAGEKVLAGEGKVMSGKQKEGGDYAEVLEIREIPKDELEYDEKIEEGRKAMFEKKNITLHKDDFIVDETGKSLFYFVLRELKISESIDQIDIKVDSRNFETFNEDD